MNRTFMTLAAAAACASGLAACAETPRTPPEPTAAALLGAEDFENDIDALNGFARLLIDSSETYREAAELAQDEALASELRSIADKREDMVSEIQLQVATLGGEPAARGGAVGTTHRAFLNVRAAFDDNTRAALAETLRAEEFLVDEAEDIARNGALSEETRRFVASFVDDLRASRDALAALQSTAEAVSTTDTASR